MTNQTDPDPAATLPVEWLALATVRRKPRPVKVVQHPAFRARARLDAPFTVVRVPVVALNGGAAPRASGCRTERQTLVSTGGAA